MRLRRPLILLLAAVGLWLPAAAAAGSDGRVGIRLVDAPVERADDPRARTSIVDHLSPGTTITRRVEVINDTDEEMAFDVYAAGADVDGGWQHHPSREGNELTDWTELRPARVAVDARSSALAEVTVAVPADAAAGERYAVIWAHPVVADDAEVRVVNRVGVRVYLSVGAGGEPPAGLEIVSLRADRDIDGHARVVVEVANTGGRALDLRGEVDLPEGPGGVRAGPFDLLPATLEVGGSQALVAETGAELPAGEWRAEATARSGRMGDSASAVVTLPDAPGVGVPGVPQPDRGWAISVALAGILLGLTSAALASAARSRR